MDIFLSSVYHLSVCCRKFSPMIYKKDHVFTVQTVFRTYRFSFGIFGRCMVTSCHRHFLWEKLYKQFSLMLFYCLKFSAIDWQTNMIQPCGLCVSQVVAASAQGPVVSPGTCYGCSLSSLMNGWVSRKLPWEPLLGL